MKNIVVIVGSKNDLKQCVRGLDVLATYASQDQIKVTVHVKSVHRHTERLQYLLRTLSKADETDVIIAGAGKAAALPGFVDGYLRNYIKDGKIMVLGVAFTGGNDLDNTAAILSITQVPGTQVIYAGQGSDGFKNACAMACEKNDFPAIALNAEIPPDLNLLLDQAIKLAQAA